MALQPDRETVSVTASRPSLSKKEFLQSWLEEDDRKNEKIQELQTKLDTATQSQATNDERITHLEEQQRELEEQLKDKSQMIEHLNHQLLQAESLEKNRAASEEYCEAFFEAIEGRIAKYRQIKLLTGQQRSKSIQTSPAPETNRTPEPVCKTSASSSLLVDQSLDLRNGTASHVVPSTRSELQNSISSPPDPSLDIIPVCSPFFIQEDEVGNTSNAARTVRATNGLSNTAGYTVCCETDSSDDELYRPPRKRTRTETRQRSPSGDSIVVRTSENHNQANNTHQVSPQAQPDTTVDPAVLSSTASPMGRAPVAPMLPQTARDALSHMRVQGRAETPAGTSPGPATDSGRFPIAMTYDPKQDKITIPFVLGQALQQEMKKLIAEADKQIKLGSSRWRESFFLGSKKDLTTCLYSRVQGHHSADYLPPLPGMPGYRPMSQPAGKPQNPATRPSRLAPDVACRLCSKHGRPCINRTKDGVVVLPLHESLRENYRRNQLQYWVNVTYSFYDPV